MEHGKFYASREFGFDPVLTEEEIRRCGAIALRKLGDYIGSGEPSSVDRQLIRRIHKLWFESTFPEHAGIERTVFVLNRKQTAYHVTDIVEGVELACADWRWQHENQKPQEASDAIEWVIQAANELVVQIYDIHPFIDGNTRTAWHLRNYALMLNDLPPLDTLTEEEGYLDAWWTASPGDHELLDDAVLIELDPRL